MPNYSKFVNVLINLSNKNSAFAFYISFEIRDNDSRDFV